MRDSLTVTSAMTLRHEGRLKEHQQWLEDNELAYTRHRIAMAEINATMKQVLAIQAENAERWRRLEAKMDAFIDSLQKGGNGHN